MAAPSLASPLCNWLAAACISARYEEDHQFMRSSAFHSPKRPGHWSIRRRKKLLPKCSNSGGGSAHKKPIMKQRRVVVTGLGVVTPLGHDPEVLYNNLLEGVSGISEIESFDCSKFPSRIGGEIKSFSADEWVSPKISRRADKFMIYMLIAGKKALRDGGITEEVNREVDKSKCGVIVGSACGGLGVCIETFCL